VDEQRVWLGLEDFGILLTTPNDCQGSNTRLRKNKKNGFGA